MKKNNKIREALTFDDILLVPQYSEILPRDVSRACQLTKNIKLNTPFLSAAMDTVTEYKMGIALAREGGMGVIHKNLSIEDQAEQVDLVKRSESGMILDPITLDKESKVGDALQIMRENKIGGIPVVEEDMKLVGIVTNRDLRLEKDMNLSVMDVMTCENIVTTQMTDLENAERILQENKILQLLK